MAHEWWYKYPKGSWRTKFPHPCFQGRLFSMSLAFFGFASSFSWMNWTKSTSSMNTQKNVLLVWDCIIDYHNTSSVWKLLAYLEFKLLVRSPLPPTLRGHLGTVWENDKSKWCIYEISLKCVPHFFFFSSWKVSRMILKPVFSYQQGILSEASFHSASHVAHPPKNTEMSASDILETAPA